MFIFLDRDGVINVNRSDHVKAWDEFEFLPGSLEAIANLTNAGYKTFVITNQAVINRGQLTHAALGEIHARMQEQIARHGGKIEAVLYCPHLPEEHCECRKPRPGLILKARQHYGVKLENSWLIGDHLTDINAGVQAGCRNLMVLSGRTKAWQPDMQVEAVLPNLNTAANYIIEKDLTAVCQSSNLTPTLTLPLSL